MKHLTSILAISILLTIVLACSQGTKPAETPKPNDSNSNGTKLETKSETNKSTTSSNDLAGTYSIKGSSLDGKGYDGELVVTKRDDVYQMSWGVGGSKYDGVAVQNGNAVAASYTTGTDGKGCGAVIYKINADDSLEGKWGEWGVNQVGTETATAMEKVEKSIGVFNIYGTNGTGTSYKGKLGIRRDSEDVYQFAWDTGGTKYIGTGVKMGDYLAAGSGSKQCGFVIYEVKDGKLDGKWGVPGTTKLGTETATKK